MTYLLFSWLLAVSASADSCSLIVKVQNEGKNAEFRVRVEEQDGRAVEKPYVEGGVRFCNLGIRPVTVKVGDAACNQAVVRNVQLDWGVTATVSVIYDSKPCMNDQHQRAAACKVLLRFVDARGRPPDSLVSLKAKLPMEESYVGDEFGRVLVRMAIGQQLVAVGTARGYNAVEVKIPCTRENRVLEQFVNLEKPAR